ncbi:MAG: 4Fe-4S binding protein [Bacteroidales bacterium]
MAISINKARCPQNHRCPLLNICPTGAIQQNKNELPQIDTKKCIECGKCIKSCAMQAVYKDHGTTL